MSGIHGALSDGAICVYFWALDYALTVSESRSQGGPATVLEEGRAGLLGQQEQG